MSKTFITILICLITVASFAQQTSSYDKHLADSLGADDYGMKAYILVILKTGSGKVDDKNKRDSIFHGHLNNSKRLASIGKLVVAGPMFDNDKKMEGIFIFNVATIEEANALLQTDPAVNAKLLEPELYKWYGSAALPEYLKYHEKIMKKQL